MPRDYGKNLFFNLVREDREVNLYLCMEGSKNVWVVATVGGFENMPFCLCNIWVDLNAEDLSFL